MADKTLRSVLYLERNRVMGMKKFFRSVFFALITHELQDSSERGEFLRRIEKIQLFKAFIIA